MKMRGFWKKFAVAVFVPGFVFLSIWGTFVSNQYMQSTFKRMPASLSGGAFSNFNCVELVRGLTHKSDGVDYLKQTYWYKKFSHLGPDVIERAKPAKVLPNKRIKVSQAQLKSLEKKLGSKSYQAFLNLLNLDENPHVLMAGMEYILKDLGARASVGGEAVVITDIINEMLDILRKTRPNAKLSFAFPGFSGKGSLAATGKGVNVGKLNINMGSKVEQVDILRFEYPNGATIYSLEHPIFAQRPATPITGVKRPKWSGAGNVYDDSGNLVFEEVSANAYTPLPNKIREFYESIADLGAKERQEAIDAVSDERWLEMWTVAEDELFSGRVEWEDLYTYSLFSKATVELQNKIESNILHLHDSHTALAGMLADEDKVVSLTIHNAGAAYQGRAYTIGFGDGFTIDTKDFGEIPWAGDESTIDAFMDMLDIAGVDMKQFYNYLVSSEGNGDLMSLGAINRIGQLNLIGGMPVSEGYQAELKLEVDEIVSIIKREVGEAPDREINWWEAPNGGLTALKDRILVGVTNGLALNRHAMNSGMLKNVDEVAADGSIIKHGALNFGNQLNTAAGKAQVHKNKKILKGIAQRELGLVDDPDSPLFVMVSRFVDQKDPQVVINNVRYIIENGGQVIISGEVGDEVGEAAAKQLRELAALPEMQGKLVFVEGRLQQFGKVMGGADFFFVPSKHEPCGITDIEAMWFGIVPIAKNIGGLNKGQSTLLYNFFDASNVEGHTYKLRTKIDEAFDLFFNKQDDFHNLRITGLNQRFPLEAQYSQFFENYRTSDVYKLFLRVKEEAGSVDDAVAQMRASLELLPDDAVEYFTKILKMKQDPDAFEQELLKFL